MISASLQQRKTRTRRSMLFVPGANAAMVSNSFISVSYTHLDVYKRQFTVRYGLVQITTGR